MEVGASIGLASASRKLSASRTQHYNMKRTRVCSNAQTRTRPPPSTTVTRTTTILTVKLSISLQSRIRIDRFAVSDTHVPSASGKLTAHLEVNTIQTSLPTLERQCCWNYSLGSSTNAFRPSTLRHQSVRTCTYRIGKLQLA